MSKKRQFLGGTGLIKGKCCSKRTLRCLFTLPIPDCLQQEAQPITSPSPLSGAWTGCPQCLAFFGARLQVGVNVNEFVSSHFMYRSSGPRDEGSAQGLVGSWGCFDDGDSDRDRDGTLHKRGCIIPDPQSPDSSVESPCSQPLS